MDIIQSKMMKQSDNLTQFYRAYSAWIDAGAPQGQPFFRNYGLCSNICDFSDDFDQGQIDRMNYEMRNQFKNAGLSRTYPFNTWKGEYTDETICHRTHLNPKRIAWVKDHLVSPDNQKR